MKTEIEQEQATKMTLESKLAIAITEHAEAQAERGEVAYAALTAADKESTPGDKESRLEAAETRVVKAEQRITSLQTALQSCEEKLTRLQQQRVAAYRQSKQNEYQAAQDALIVEAEAVEAALQSLITAKTKIDARLVVLDDLALQAGIDNAPHRSVRKNIRRALAHRLNYSETWMASDVRQLYSKPLSFLLRHVLTGAAVEQTAVNE